MGTMHGRISACRIPLDFGSLPKVPTSGYFGMVPIAGGMQSRCTGMLHMWSKLWIFYNRCGFCPPSLGEWGMGMHCELHSL